MDKATQMTTTNTMPCADAFNCGAPNGLDNLKVESVTYKRCSGASYAGLLGDSKAWAVPASGDLTAGRDVAKAIRFNVPSLEIGAVADHVYVEIAPFPSYR
jgi:hypothetical protein